MNKDFGKWLKENEQVWGKGKTKCCWINKRVLGKFEISEILRLQKENEENFYEEAGIDLAYNEGVIQYLKERAIACLGKETTERLLKEGEK